jgi:DNA-binding transcriptional LysR family regulator
MADGKADRMDSVDDMLLVIEVADAGSFTQAGVRLGLPKSTVSNRIAALESRLGLRLFNRSTRLVNLTNTGQVYLEYCRRVRAEVAAANMAMNNLKEQPQGMLRITCPEVTATYFMPKFLGEFAREFPLIQLQVIATNQHIDLIREGVDFAFRVGTVSSQDLIVRKISTISRVLVASPGYLNSASSIAVPNDLEKHRCLVHDALPEWTFIRAEAHVTVRPPAAASSDSLGFLLRSSIEGLGVALLPAYVCRPAIASGQLLEVLPGWDLKTYDMRLVFADRRNQSKAQAAFRDFVDSYDFSNFAES